MKRYRTSKDLSYLSMLTTDTQCELGNPCSRCISVGATATVWTMPCFRGRLSDVELRGPGELPLSRLDTGLVAGLYGEYLTKSLDH